MVYRAFIGRPPFRNYHINRRPARKRNQGIHLQFTDAEVQELINTAREHGYPPGDWIRKKCLNRRIKPYYLLVYNARESLAKCYLCGLLFETDIGFSGNHYFIRPGTVCPNGCRLPGTHQEEEQQQA